MRNTPCALVLNAQDTAVHIQIITRLMRRDLTALESISDLGLEDSIQSNPTSSNFRRVALLVVESECHCARLAILT